MSVMATSLLMLELDTILCPINEVIVELGSDPPESGHIGDSYAASASVAEASASKTSGATRLHQECRRRVL